MLKQNCTRTRWLHIALSTLIILFSLGINSAWADSWTKVTAEPASWAGEYLLIRETSSTAGKAWTGVDAASCQVDATISSGTISSTPSGAVTLTIAAVTGGYSIKVNGGTNNGKYIYGTSGSNALNFNASAQVNTISYDGTNNCADIVSNTSHIRYNTNRFRYYKSSTYTSSSVVQLYKKDASCSNKVTLTKGSPSNGSFSLSHYPFSFASHLHPSRHYTKSDWRETIETLSSPMYMLPICWLLPTNPRQYSYPNPNNIILYSLHITHYTLHKKISVSLCRYVAFKNLH